RQWEGIDIRDVKALWAHELAAYERRLDAIAWALDHLPPKCPNLVEFKDLCREAPRHEPLPLPEPPADPARVKAELAKLGHKPPGERASGPVTVDNKAWAKRIIARHEQGEKIRPISLRFAREALRMGEA
ncbi:MAG: hypothetical protein N2690_07355, partial [Rhodocyclaceae bacterium]|nr:hypothetical protein [Rhodocyclaceae bacterium]